MSPLQKDVDAATAAYKELPCQHTAERLEVVLVRLWKEENK